MIILSVIISYVIGSIPTGYIYGKKAKGIDIREHGSGNLGATNVFRVLGKGPGAIVLILDILKGIITVALVADILGTTAVYERILVALATVSGHNWTVFLQFKGGKGIATSLGVLIGLTLKITSIQPVLASVLLIWLTSFLITKFVSLSSLLASVSLPIIMALTSQPFELVCLGVIFAVFVVFRHKANIGRLLKGEEPRVVLFRKK